MSDSEHIAAKRLSELADGIGSTALMGQPEWQHMQNCVECIQTYTEMVRHRRIRASANDPYDDLNNRRSA